MNKTDLFICECHDVNHQLILSVMDDEPIIYGHYHLDNYGLMNRIKNAIKYIIAKGQFKGDFDNFLFNINDIDRFKSIISILDEENNISTLLSITPEREFTPNMGKASLTKRIIRGCKHICGYRSCFGDFDAFEFTKEDFPALNKFIQIAEVVK